MVADPAASDTRGGASALPSLSVVMATFNAAATIGEQLDALAEQEYPAPWELVVADNGSTDATLAVVEAHRTQLPGLVVVDASWRRGPSHARNHGAAAARGDVLVFVDQDDKVAPGYLLALGVALRRAPFVAARIDHLSLNPDWLRHCRRHWQTEGLVPTDYLPAASGCSLGVRRTAFLGVGGFREEFLYAQDIDLCWRLQEEGASLTFVPDAVLHYRYRPTLWQAFDQERRWGTDDALLYARHRRSAGFRRRSLRAARNDWLALLRQAATARGRADLAECAGSLGRRLGRLQGSVRYRVLFP